MSNEIIGKKAVKKTGLGRGLGSLLGGPLDEDEKKSEAKAAQAPSSVARSEVMDSVKVRLKEDFVNEKPAPRIPDTARIWNVSIDKIYGNREQPRKYFAKETLSELASSIKQQGILQPIVARKKGDEFEIIAGERRWRAAQIAGLHEVPVILKESGDQKSLELALIENVQREDLNPIEEARAYSFLMKEYGLTQQTVADKVGKERATVANVLRLLNLVPEVQEHVAEGSLSVGQAKLLLSVIDGKKQKSIAKKVIKNNLTVKATEKLINKVKSSDVGADVDLDEIIEVDVSQKLIKGLTEELQKLMGTKVSIDYSNGKGKFSVHFYSDDEFNNLVDKVRKEWQS